jgi:hypothetical protein
MLFPFYLGIYFSPHESFVVTYAWICYNTPIFSDGCQTHQILISKPPAPTINLTRVGSDIWSTGGIQS